MIRSFDVLRTVARAVARALPASLLATTCAWAVPAAAQTFPAGPVTLVHGLPGGLVDAAARVLGEQLSAKWKQPVIVEGKPGANEMIAAEFVARAPKTGQVLFIGSESALVNNALLYRTPIVDAQRDLEPVGELFDIPFALVVRAESGVDTLAQWIALMKASGKDRVYGSAGIGSPLQLAMEGFARTAGFEIRHVPYKTIAQLAQDMLGGTLDASFLGVTAALNFAKSGKLKVLAVTGATRSAASPSTPTFAELGYPGVDDRTLIAVAAPKGTPAAVVARLQADFREALNSGEFASRVLTPQDLSPGRMDAKALADVLASRRATTQRLIRALDIRLD